MPSRSSLSAARTLRKNLTDAEHKLWRSLRNRRFLEFKFRRQHPIGPYIADFCCVSKKLVIEVDGGQHVVNRGYDEIRSQWLKSLGYRVIRFWNHEVLAKHTDILEKVYQELEQRGTIKSLNSQ
jgi:very-short-patch-repair endonuclease